MPPVEPTPIATTDSVIASAATQKVYTRRRWEDDWEEVPALWLEECDLCASPSITEARFLYRYGVGIEPGAATTEERRFRELAPKDLLHHYIKVEITPTKYGGTTPAPAEGEEPFFWYGVIEESTQAHDGSVPSGIADERVPNGMQFLRAYGLEFLLERTIISTAFVFDYEETTETEIGRAITFNAGLGQARDNERRGNMSHATGVVGTYLFTGRLDEGQEWTAKDILEYLISYHQPKGADGTSPLNLVLDEEGSHANLEVDKPILETSGRTLRGLLDQLADRRRLHCWRLIVNEELNQVLVRVDTFLSEEIELEEDPALSITKLEPNQVQKQLDFETAFDVISAVTTKSLSHGYDRVTIRGAKRGCVGTFCFADDTLEAGWDTGELETEYEQAATQAEGYGDLEDYIKIRRCAMFRESEKYDPVFSYFRVPRDWDGKVGDGEGGEKAPICPSLEGEIFEADPAPFWRAGLRFERQLPLELGTEYDGAKITERLITTGITTRPPDPSPDATYLPLLAMAKFWTDEDTDRYARLDKIKQQAGQPTHDGDDWTQAFTWSAHTGPLENELGVEIRVTPQWLLAKADYSPTEEEVDANLFEQAIDWQHIRITAMISMDQYVEQSNPVEPLEQEDLEAGDTPRTLTIDVGDRCRLDYVAPGTWVAVEDGIPMKTLEGGFVRDDRLTLKNLATLAGAWYLLPRQAFSMVFRQIRPILNPGELIITIKQGGEDVQVNSLVTRVRYDFNAQTTTVQTDFAELDVGAFL